MHNIFIIFFLPIPYLDNFKLVKIDCEMLTLSNNQQIKLPQKKIFVPNNLIYI